MPVRLSYSLQGRLHTLNRVLWRLKAAGESGYGCLCAEVSMSPIQARRSSFTWLPIGSSRKSTPARRATLMEGMKSVSSAIKMIWSTMRLWARLATSRPVLMSTPVCFKPTISKSFGHMDSRLAFGHLKGRQGLGLFPSDRGSYTLMYMNLHPWAPRGFSRS